MTLQAPNLDDRQFLELFEEMRALIPRYAPEWTDHNLSDPGITMMQLFAWLGEIILFRLNRVPDRNYIKFLQLIGVEQKPAVPAQAEVTFLLVQPALPIVFIPKGTRISAQVKPPPPSALAYPTLPPEPEDPVIFETDEPLIALGAVLQAVLVAEGATFTDYTEANQVAQQHYPAFGNNAENGNALLLGFAFDGTFPEMELNLFVQLFVEPNNAQETRCDRQTESFPSTEMVVWEYWNGSNWQRLSLLKDETRSLTQTGHIYFRTPTDSQAFQKRTLSNISESLYWIRCQLVDFQYDRTPKIDAILTNTVRAIAITTVRDEVIGSSNGQPNQFFRLRNAPIYAKALRSVDERLRENSTRSFMPNEVEQKAINEKLRQQELIKGFLLEVDEGQGAEPWEEVEDFFNSNAGDRHYTLNRTTGDITFGNGESGRIPLAGINNLVVRYYRYGGGRVGNVGADMITDLQSPVPGIDKVTNYWAAEGGDNEELIQDTKARAPKELKARDRAVTIQDFEFLALQTPGVRIRRAYALPLYHPQFPDTSVPGAITVIVIPDSIAPNPIPSQKTLQAVCAYLNQHRLLTTEIFVAPPKYIQVSIEASVLTRPTANSAEVKTQIETTLNTYLNPLTGGEDGLGWDLGAPVLHSEIFRRILNISGVQRIENLQIVVNGERFPPCTDAPIPINYLVFSTDHDITVNLTAAI
ncbi:putative baseplate assembly protein [Floridanema aerugineum]|uniref:Baseplate assembly protein n=1 Tax=Floridaenema aerugineum BLCC-F46 TaxID=3153654 RepID=A0ABV4XFL0_9CYAN